MGGEEKESKMGKMEILIAIGDEFLKKRSIYISLDWSISVRLHIETSILCRITILGEVA